MDDRDAFARELGAALQELGWDEEQVRRYTEHVRASEEAFEREKAAAPVPPPLVVSPEATRLVEEAALIPRPWDLTAGELRAHPAVRAIVDAAPGVRRECVLLVCREKLRVHGDGAPSVVLSIIARKSLPLTIDDIATLVIAGEHAHAHRWHTADGVFRALAHQLQQLYERSDSSGRAELAVLFERAAMLCHYRQDCARLRAIAAVAVDPIDAIDVRDDVGPRVKAVLTESGESRDAVRAFAALLVAYPATGKPSKQWHGKAADTRAALALPAELVAGVLRAAVEAEDVRIEHLSTGHWFETGLLAGQNERYLCGAAVFAGTLGDPTLLPDLRKLAAKAIAMPPQANPRSVKLANACAEAIAQIGGPAAIGELLALERTTRHGTLLRTIRKAIDTLAAARDLTRSGLLERAVEMHGLEPDGTASISLSRGSALLQVNGTTVSLSFIDETGAQRQAFPAAVKEADADTLTELRERAKAIRKTIATERGRLEELLREQRSWTLEDWTSLYLDHPITGQLARRLIWRFGTLDGIPVDATTARTAAGEVRPIPRGCTVELWHPIAATPDEIHDWRAHLLATEAVQPLKQAYRELYLRAPAEEETRVYSNRFAGHVIRQTQAKSLMKKRGWQPVAVAWWDDGIDHGAARRTYEAAGIRAEFFFDPVLDIEPDTTDLYPYCTTDQVRFFAAATDEAIELPEVPPLVFTETMRDVDLFVSVTSIGADPEWLDRREGRRFETYWQQVSFGDLTAAAEIRREVLAQLLPMLVIADRCKLEERYLVVRGDLRTYRIHLGSSNILIEPDDQYLCIVAARDRRADKLSLPFDDDPTLSLILSKAFLLADDTAITDPTITAQIARPR
jgi:hypothetical protein